MLGRAQTVGNAWDHSTEMAVGVTGPDLRHSRKERHRLRQIAYLAFLSKQVDPRGGSAVGSKEICFAILLTNN